MDPTITLLETFSLATFRRPSQRKPVTIREEYTTNLPNMDFSMLFRVQTRLLPLLYENMKDKKDTSQERLSVTQKKVVAFLISLPTPTPKICTLVVASICWWSLELFLQITIL